MKTPSKVHLFLFSDLFYFSPTSPILNSKIITKKQNQSSVNLLRNCMTSMELDSLSPVPHHKSPSVARPTTPTTSKRQEGPKNFAFDSIMGEASSQVFSLPFYFLFLFCFSFIEQNQADVFEQVEPLVSAVMQGYNATIFVYGYLFVNPFPFVSHFL